MKMKLTGVIMCLMILFFISCKTMEMGKSASPDLLEYSKIYDYEGKGQDELYVKANAWFVDNFNSAESVIQFQDKESGKLMGKYASKAKITIY